MRTVSTNLHIGVPTCLLLPLPPAGRPVELSESNTIVRRRLRLRVLGLGESQLSVGQLEDRSDPGVEPALGKAEPRPQAEDRAPRHTRRARSSSASVRTMACPTARAAASRSAAASRGP